MINTYQLFSVPLVETKLIIQIPLLTKVKNWCKENNKNENFISLRGGYQEHTDFDGKEELDEIINSFLRIHMKEKILHGWLNILNKNGDNTPHQHLGDNVINSGGIKLHPEKIEKALSKIISNRFFVAGKLDETLGEKLILIIEGNRKNLNFNESELLKFEIPKEIYFVEKFLETETKKIQRRKTLDLIKI